MVPCTVGAPCEMMRRISPTQPDVVACGQHLAENPRPAAKAQKEASDVGKAPLELASNVALEWVQQRPCQRLARSRPFDRWP